MTDERPGQGVGVGARGSLASLIAVVLREIAARHRLTPFDAAVARTVVERIGSLAADEGEVALSREARAGSADASRAWIASRVQRALQSAIDDAARARGVPAPRAPRVVVARTPQAGTPPRCTTEVVGASGDVVLLSDAAGVDRFLERHQDLTVGEKNLRFHVGGGGRDERVTIGFAPTDGQSGVEVLEGATALCELDWEVARALEAAAGETVAEGEAAPAATDLVGHVLGGKYELVERIGKGGFGCVYKARDLRLDTHVAVKVLHRGGRSLAALTALRDEARRLTRLDHPNIVDWKTFDESEDGTGYIVMELLEGEDLESVLEREGPLPPVRVAHFLLEIVRALRAAHTLPDGGTILHLDLKPRNVLVLGATSASGDERVKVIDFGIAQHGDDDSTAQLADAYATDPLATLHSTIRGAGSGAGVRSSACTPEYAAPEHCAHLVPDVVPVELDGRADLYSLGVIGFQLLTGRLPFEGVARSRADLLEWKLAHDAPPVSTCAPGVPRDLARFVDRCLQRDRAHRHADANEACRELERIVHPSRARAWAAAATMAALSMAGVVWGAWPDAPLVPLDARVATHEGERPLTGAEVWLGPATPRIALALEPEGESPGELVLVASVEDPRPIQGLAVVRERDGAARIEIGEDAPPGARAMHLVRRERDGRARSAGPFTVRCVPLESLSIEDAGVEGLRGRALDPRGARLDVDVAGELDLVRRVEVDDGRRVLLAHASARPGRWQLDLGEFGWGDGAQSVVVRVIDAANGARNSTLRFEVAGRDLELAWACDAPRFGERATLTPATRATARASASRTASFSWRVVAEDGTELLTGSMARSSALELDLAAVAAELGVHSFDGALEVAADDSEFVHHARSGGVARRREPIAFRTERPALRAWTKPPAGGAEVEIDADSVLAARDVVFPLRLARDCEMPIRFEVVSASDGSVLHAGTLDDRLRASMETTIRLDGEGLHGLVLRATAVGTDDRTSTPFTVVVQSEPSTLALDPPAARVVAGAARAIEFSVRLAPPPAASEAWMPARARWTLRGPGGQEIAGPEPIVLRPDEPAAFAVAARDAAGEPLADGAWRLVVEATDAAGRGLAPCEARVDVALAGPRVDIVLPLADATWEPGANGLELRATARDPNGVSRVAARVRRAGTDAVHVCDLAREGSDGSGWRGRIQLPGSWSSADVEIEVVAHDALDVVATETFDRRTGDLYGAIPACIRAGEDAPRTADMRLVRGNADGVYVFGGRGDELENAAARRAGLPAFNALQTARSWRVELPPGAVEDYYLDEREVTVGEFLAFVRDDSQRGYRALLPSAPGAGELEARLLALDPQLPVTGVSWPEARAFATYAGKDLPSALQWEYALRGGSLYRPAGAFAPGVGVESARGLLAARSLHVAAETGDVTPDTAIADLTGNAAEWTATPVEHDADGGVVAPRFTGRAHSADRYWVVGGAWSGSRRDFSVLDRRRAEARSDSIGFRCALTAAAFRARPEQTGLVRFVPCP